MINKVQANIAGKIMSLETGKMAKQADGAVVIRYGDTMALVTIVAGKEMEGIDFLPLTVEFKEAMSAAGRIPGGFIKREGKPSNEAILAARLVDRPLRPLFAKGWNRDLQIIVTPLSIDSYHTIDILGVIGASAAASISPIPFDGPVGAVRVGKIDGKIVINPTDEELEKSDLDLVVAGKKDGIVMVEAGANELSEEEMLEALEKAHEVIKEIIELQEQLVNLVNPEKEEVNVEEPEEEFVGKVEEYIEKIEELMLKAKNKKDRSNLLKELKEEIKEKLLEKWEEEYVEKFFESVWHEVEKKAVRDLILNKGKRPDNRKPEEIRPIDIEVGVLPRPHGSALFTRGETQALATVTLGVVGEEQIIDSMFGDERREYFILHYNFPPYCTGEAKPIRGPSRREIGHGNLARRAIFPMIPDRENFPYTIRVVSEILESNGSSSMATVCAGTLALMDAGVKMKKPVAGIAMGLVVGEEKTVILTDIMGMEDHCGDMDFKVAGTKDGITALQMDLKIAGIPYEVMKKALYQAKEARMFVLDKMSQVIKEPREKVSIYAPKVKTYKLHNKEQIADLIGPAGKHIKDIIAKTDAKIEIDDENLVVYVSAPTHEQLEQALNMVKSYTMDLEVGSILEGVVKRVADFGLFVELKPGKEGLVHISEVLDARVGRLSDFVKEGDKILVKIIKVDELGRVNLSRKQAIHEINGTDDISKRVNLDGTRTDGSGSVGSIQNKKSNPRGKGHNKPHKK